MSAPELHGCGVSWLPDMVTRQCPKLTRVPVSPVALQLPAHPLLVLCSLRGREPSPCPQERAAVSLLKPHPLTSPHPASPAPADLVRPTVLLSPACLLESIFLHTVDFSWRPVCPGFGVDLAPAPPGLDFAAAALSHRPLWPLWKAALSGRLFLHLERPPAFACEPQLCSPPL